MKKLILFMVLCTFLTINTGENAYANENQLYQSSELSDTYIVSFLDKVDRKLITDLDGKIIKEYKYALTIVAKLSNNAVEVLENSPKILSVEIDGLVEATGIATNTPSQTIKWTPSSRH